MKCASDARVRVTLRGAVQGVGFRPFIYNLATSLGLTGWVRNTSAGLITEVEGGSNEVQMFLARVDEGRPPAALIQSREIMRISPVLSTSFTILASDGSDAKTAGLLADLATCPDCLDEILSAEGRRAGYAFTNCTRCGPRYTILEGIPYDRPNTSMRGFKMCEACRAEYEDPHDRRFHAQPIACPTCGPRLSSAVEEAAWRLTAGQIVALKGIGGYQLLCDATNTTAVTELRRRKQREAKPFAVMMPDVYCVRDYCQVQPEEAALLASPGAPIVLLRPYARGRQLPMEVAGRSPYLGVMLPYSPLHHLLMRALPRPIVATSGNLSDEPIAIGNAEAHGRLGAVGDFFLDHDRPIVRPCDDSVARVVRRSPSLIRRARGYAPLPVSVGCKLPPFLAVGGHFKNTVAIAASPDQAVLSQHIGDLDTLDARRAFERAIEDLCRLYDFEPEAVVCDLHPDYASTFWARASGRPVRAVQHHHAHAAACAAENHVSGPYLAVTWDGTGFGTDGAIWGSEFFRVDAGRFERVAHLRPFRLAGGDAAAKDCWRSAASLVIDSLGAGAIPGERRNAVIELMITRGIHAPWTTSAGRLFDAVAAITGVASRNDFEGQAPMALEGTIEGCTTDDLYPLPGGDWRPLIECIVADMRIGRPVPEIAACFHNALVQWIIDEAQNTGLGQVVLSGGVFQNGYLLERTATHLEALDFRVFTHHAVPSNDGGIALGQLALAAEENYDVSGCSR